ncbi:hypothetical protein JCM5296_001563 [Sporobolomyces johnsonii]
MHHLAVTSAPSPTASASIVLPDDTSERIYAALLSAAASHSSPLCTLAPTVSPDGFMSFSINNVTTATTASSTGFLTSRLAELPSAVSVLVGVWLIVLAFGFLGAGARSVFVGRDLGRTYGSNEKEGWLQGGVGGVLFGSTCVSAFATLLTLLVVSRQSSASLSAWGTLAIALCPALLGAVAGGRWTWASKGSAALVGGLSLTLLFTTSFHPSTVLPRLVLLAILLVFSLFLTFLAPTRRFALPALAALSGAWLLVIGIDVFVHYGFVDALGLLVAKDGVGEMGGNAEECVVQWGSGRGKGLAAGWWLLAAAGGAWQGVWGLGTEGDELWNAYLTQFLSTHPAQPLGTHFPAATFSERLKSFVTLSFLSKRRRPGGAFTDLPRRTPWDDDDVDAGADETGSFDLEKGFAQKHKKHSYGHSDGEREPSDAWDSDADTLAGLGGRLVRPSTRTTTRTLSSKPARYGAVSSSDEDEEGVDGKSLWSAAKASMADKKVLRKKGSSGGMSGLSGRTAVSFTTGAEKDRREEDKVEQKGLEKADQEREAVASLPRLAKDSIATSNTKDSMVKHFSGHTTRINKPASYSGLETSEREIPPPNVVPATPSLIKAIKRVSAAQRQARHSSPLAKEESKDGDARVGKVAQVDEPSMSLKHESSVGSTRGRRSSMDEWWKEVVKKSEGKYVEGGSLF